MAAKVDTKFSRGFFLSEEALTKIEELVKLRLSGPEDYVQRYDVHRVDDAVVSYDKAASVVGQEENTKRNAVKGLDLEVTSALGHMTLNFEKGEKSALVIESPDRDRALLLPSDLKEYLKNEVLIRRLAFISNFVASRIFLPITMLVTMIPFFGFVVWRIDQPHIDVVRATDTEKLNYLVGITQSRDEIGFIPLYFLAWMLCILFAPILLTSPRVYPAYTFYWGKEISRYDTAKSIRSRVFWVVLVGLVVSIVAAYLSKDF